MPSEAEGVSAIAQEARTGWLTVVYRVPSKPSTARVAVWKLAQELGGFPLQQSVYVFPERPEIRVGLAQLQRRIEDGGGEMTLFEVPALDEAKVGQFTSELNRLRDGEYAEIVEDCEEIVHRLDRKTEHAHFDADEVRDAREDHERIREHFEAIVARDYFGSGQRPVAEAAVATCDQRIAAFTEEVGAVEGAATVSAPAQGGHKKMKAKLRGVYPAPEAIARAREALDAFEAGTLVIDGTGVGELAESALLECKYSDRTGKRCLEIEFEW